jgi:copper resistance protein C
MLMTCFDAARRTLAGRTRALALAVLVALPAVLLTAGPAQAHTALKESSPAKGATVPSPSQIVLTFTDSVIVPQVVVTGASGAKHQSGPAKAKGDKVTQPIEGTLEPGTYTVGWRVVSADGHPVTGTYKFTVEGAPKASGTPGQAAVPAPVPQASTTDSGSTSSKNVGSENAGSSWLWVGLAALVVALLVAGGSLIRRRRAGR